MTKQFTITCLAIIPGNDRVFLAIAVLHDVTQTIAYEMELFVPDVRKPLPINPFQVTTSVVIDRRNNL